MRELKNNPMSSMPQFVKFPVETREEFRRFWRERMQPNLKLRIGPDGRIACARCGRQPAR